MPTNFDISKAKSLGMKLVNILARQLKGKAHWENDSGARFIVNFNESAARKVKALGPALHPILLNNRIHFHKLGLSLQCDLV